MGYGYTSTYTDVCCAGGVGVATAYHRWGQTGVVGSAAWATCPRRAGSVRHASLCAHLFVRYPILCAIAL